MGARGRQGCGVPYMRTSEDREYVGRSKEEAGRRKVVMEMEKLRRKGIRY